MHGILKRANGTESTCQSVRKMAKTENCHTIFKSKYFLFVFPPFSRQLCCSAPPTPSLRRRATLQLCAKCEEKHPVAWWTTTTTLSMVIVVSFRLTECCFGQNVHSSSGSFAFGAHSHTHDAPDLYIRNGSVAMGDGDRGYYGCITCIQFVRWRNVYGLYLECLTSANVQLSLFLPIDVIRAGKKEPPNTHKHTRARTPGQTDGRTDREHLHGKWK